MLFVLIILALKCTQLLALTSMDFESNITFYGWNSQAPTTRFVSVLNNTASDDGCNPAGNFTFIVHDWLESVDTAWVPITVNSLIQHRTGCVYVMDYSHFANVAVYTNLSPNFKGIADVLTKKVTFIENYDRQYFFASGFGSRLSVEAGKRIGNQTIDRMDLCDPTASGFDVSADPTSAAKNVGCINTSYDKGTYTYNCHQNFRMGYCGYTQAAGYTFSFGNHGLCPYMYNFAFKFDFVPNNYYGCWSSRMVSKPSNDVKMGYLASFDRKAIRGDIFIATASEPPFIATSTSVDNHFSSLLTFLDIQNC